MDDTSSAEEVRRQPAVMLRQGHLRNGANLRPDGPGESKVAESSECDKELFSGNARNDNKTFYVYLILGEKGK